MINLLPPEIYENIKYGRQNTKLFRWSLTLVFTIVGIGLVIFLGSVYMRQSTQNYAKQIDQQQAQLREQKLEETQKRVEDLSNNLKLAVDVLSREVLFSKLIQQIGTAIPENASLSNLQINALKGGIDIVAIAADYNSAAQVQVNLQDPGNKIFDKADLINITCSGSASADPRYPCTVTVRAQFAQDNPFLFINDSASSGADT